MIQPSYKPRSLVGRIAFHYGVSKRTVRDTLFAGAALFAVAVCTLAILAR